MRLLRAFAGVLLWILAGVLGLVSLLLCVTIILLPLGIPLFRLSKALFGKSVRLMLPPAVAHPVKETRKKGEKAKPEVPEVASKAGQEAAQGDRQEGQAAAQEGQEKPARRPATRLERPPGDGASSSPESRLALRDRSSVSGETARTRPRATFARTTRGR